MDVQITDAVILVLAFFFGGMIVSILLSRRFKKKAVALKKSVDIFSEAAYKHFAIYNSDNLEVFRKLETGDFEGAKDHVSYGIALFYHNECSTGLSRYFEIEKQKIEEIAKSSPTLAADIKKAAEMQKIAVEMKTSRLTPRWSQPAPPL